MLGNPLNLGRVVGRGRNLTLSPEDRSMHLHVSGATGTGKSKFLENLIKQDILNWRPSKCGVMLLDPHGALYDSIMRWLTVTGLDRPVIPIDLRRDDWVISYNLLRKRSANPAVIVANMVDAMAYVWGQGGTDLTPLFERWASNTLGLLYDKNLTLVEATYLMDVQASYLRDSLSRGLSSKMCEKDWAFANKLSPKDFENQIASTLNRLGRFLRNEFLRLIFGQTEVSLDLSKALDEGHIILVSLATERARVSREDSELFATLLLNDLWTAAQERGKPKNVKPFYVYVDEFQKFVTPTIAENLDQARGYGLHLTMAHQFPKQFKTKGNAGEQLYDSMMESARSKVVFQLSDEENLMPLAKWLFRGMMDPDKVKHQLYSTKVMDYVLEYKKVYSRSTTTSEGGGTTTTNTEGFTEGASGEIGEMDAVQAWSDHLSHGVAESSSWSESTSEGESDVPMLMPVIGKELTHVQFESLDEQLFRAMAVLFDQEQRQGVARLVDMTAPASFFTPTVEDSHASPERVGKYVKQLLKKWDFALPAEKAMKMLAERQKLLMDQLQNNPESDEPVKSKRRIP